MMINLKPYLPIQRLLIGDRFIPSMLSFPFESWCLPTLSMQNSSGSFTLLSISSPCWASLSTYPYLPLTKFNLNNLKNTEILCNWPLTREPDTLFTFSLAIILECQTASFCILIRCFAIHEVLTIVKSIEHFWTPKLLLVLQSDPENSWYRLGFCSKVPAADCVVDPLTTVSLLTSFLSITSSIRILFRLLNVPSFSPFRALTPLVYFVFRLPVDRHFQADPQARLWFSGVIYIFYFAHRHFLHPFFQPFDMSVQLRHWRDNIVQPPFDAVFSATSIASDLFTWPSQSIPLLFCHRYRQFFWSQF